jgi:superfamily II DNA or RNA helicase
VQTIGRGLRTAEGKDHLIILDHAGNHQRIGLVTEIDFPKLDDGEAT